VLKYDSYHEFLADRSRFQQELERQVIDNLDWEIEYAVRSSANIEDSLSYSFAGQLVSVLSVHEQESLVNAVIKVYESVESSQLASYLEKMS
jgi:phosphoenolpyruvate synthase/pyruvate phosphate dikinase